MRIVKINGGLGNQMFQFAFFLYLKEKGGYAKLDITGFQKNNMHNGLELNNVFNLIRNVNLASQVEINSFKDRTAFSKIRKILGILLKNDPNTFYKESHWIEPNYSHYYEFIYKLDNIYFEGYWQNVGYLKNQEITIKKLFDWKIIDERNQDLAIKLKNEESIAIHIRRLDTPTNINQLLYTLRLRFIWRIASKNYYLNAIKHINSKVLQPQYYIFTDNVNWVKKHIPNISKYTIIDWNRGSKSNLDMYLMSQCKHNIISMSTVGLWGAWLNNNSNKIVIAPKKWAPRFRTKDEIIPQKWIRL